MMAIAWSLTTWRRTALLILLAVIFATSLAWSLMAIGQSQPVAFFYPQSRAWELALGGLAGLTIHRRDLVPGAIRALISWAGLFAVLGSVICFGDQLTYPGLWALIPTFGAAALIFGLDTQLAVRPLVRVLTLPGVVVIGDMSYSLYLWHWPVLVFIAALWPGNQVAIWLGLVPIAVLSSAAYYWVERPIHRLPLQQVRLARIAAASIGAIVVVIGVAGGVTLLTGPTSPAVAAALKKARADLGPTYSDGCHLSYDAVEQPPCHFGAVDAPNRVVLFGDSHAAQWFPPLLIAAEKAGWTVDSRTKSSCPAVDVTIWYLPSKSTYDACDKWRKARFAEFAANPPKIVIMGSSNEYTGWLFDRSANQLAGRERNAELWQTAAAKTVKALTDLGIEVVELQDTPKMYHSVYDCLSKAEWAQCARPRSDALSGLSFSGPVQSDVVVFDPTGSLCDGNECSPVKDGRVIYRDDGHLTASFAATFAPQFEVILNDYR